MLSKTKMKRNTRRTGLVASSAALVVGVSTPATATAAVPAHVSAGTMSGWQIYQAPVDGQAAFDSVVAPAADDAWVGGFTVAANGFSPLLLHWNGQAWASVSVPDTTRIEGLSATGEDDVWAVTDDHPLHWNGRAWSAVALAPVQDMNEGGPLAADGPNDAWYLGTAYDPTTGAASNFIEEWDGCAWKQGALPAALADTGGLADIAADGPDDVWVAGTDASGALLFAHWDGRSWTSMPGPATGFTYTNLSDLVIAGGHDVWLAGWGETSDGKGADRLPLIAHWSGGNWALSPAPAGDGEIDSIAATPGGGAWAVGDTYHETGVPYSAYVLRWTGSAWVNVAVPTTGDASFDSVAAIPGGGVWAVGATADDASLTPTVEPLIARDSTG
jgi:hypothetical protein